MFWTAIFLLQTSVLRVGDGHRFSRIEQAVAAAVPGTTVEVYPSAAGYIATAVRLTVRNITVKGMGAKPIPIDGRGYEYSGEGPTPRAIFEFEPGSDGSSVSNFVLFGAHNASHNGAGVRINGANDVIVSRCDIHSNDMGMMSNGAAASRAGIDQLIRRCKIHENGDFGQPGFNHNLYLGGDSVTVDHCDIYGALTGHNLKSRAHYTVVSYCLLKGGQNRQVDLVESWDTKRPHSNALLLGDVFEPDLSATGNHNVIHFGQERGARNGTLYLVNDTVIDPFAGPLLLLDSPLCSVQMDNCLVIHPGSGLLVQAGAGATLSKVTGSGNWISGGYSLAGTGLMRVAGLPEPTVAAAQAVGFAPPGWRPAKATYEDGTGARKTADPRFRHIKGPKWDAAKVRFIGAG